jgi:protein gp37
VGDKSGIEWTDATWNPTTGCDRISPGCDHCYALTMAARLKGMGSAKYQADGNPRTSGPGFALTEHPSTLDQPLRWARPRRIFVNSMSDLFHDDVSDEFIARVFSVMAAAPQHTFQVLTKRPQRMARLLGGDGGAGLQRLLENLVVDVGGAALRLYEAEWPLPNVWLGTSIENRRYAFRADHLRATPAAVRFVSCEPLLGPLPHLDLVDIDWVIVGGESGPGARPMHPDWVRDLRDQANAAGAAFHFKQWGSHDQHGTPMTKHAAGRELDGRTWDEFPTLKETSA